MGIVRSGYWPGIKPIIEPDRKMCSDCKYHYAASAGWQFDRCSHPKADLGSVVRNDQHPTCADVRLSSAQCGKSAVWHEKKPPRSLY